MELELTTLYELRDGKIARIHQYDTLAEALEDARERPNEVPDYLSWFVEPDTITTRLPQSGGAFAMGRGGFEPPTNGL